MTEKTYFETAKVVTEAGSVLSLRSYAVCMVSLLRKTSWQAHFIPEENPSNLLDICILMMIVNI